MPIYPVPPEIKQFVVVRGDDGSFAVADEGRPPGRGFFAPCRDELQAIKLCDLLNKGEHDGRVQIDLLSMCDLEAKP